MRWPSRTDFWNSGFTRRCLLSMHSEEATITFGPLSWWSAPRATFAHPRDVIGAVDLAHPFDADALHRVDDGVVGRARRIERARRQDVLAAGGRGIDNCRRP